MATQQQPGQALLPSWANDQDGWCRSIASDVLRHLVQPADADIDGYLKTLLAEKKLSDEAYEAVPKIEEKQLFADSLEAVRVDSLTVGDGVNALKTGVQIEFASGVTVIFGENGSGKSGFVRILKRAAGVRTGEDILHNVRGDKKPTPGTNTLLASFDRSSTIYSTIETLGAATDLNEISQYAVVPDDVDAEIDSLKTEVDALRSTNIQNELKRAQDRSALVTAIKAALDAIKAFDPAAFEARLHARDRASRRREHAVTKAFEGVAIPGLLGPEWRQFVQAGEEYLKKHAFGRPMRTATRAAGEEFLVRYYRRFAGQATCPAPLPTVPDHYDEYVRAVRSICI